MFYWRYGILVVIFWDCDALNVVIMPCGFRLCRDLCDSLSSCSSPDYRVETLTCVLRNGSLGVGQEGVIDCRTLTSRRGDNVTVCSKDVIGVKGGKRVRAKEQNFSQPGPVDGVGIKFGSRVDVNSLKGGTPVLLSNNVYGLYMGYHKVIFMDHQDMKMKKLDDSAFKSIVTFDAGTAKVVDPSQRVKFARSAYFSRKIPYWKSFGHLDLVVYCLTMCTYRDALKLGFKLKD